MQDEDVDELVTDFARLGALRAARQTEMRLRRLQAEKAAASAAAANGEPNLVLIGRYLGRSRAQAQMSQQALADKARVSQSMVSRTERGIAGAMRFDRFARMVVALDRLFPLGCCPHDHTCPWQPIRPPAPFEASRETSFIERMLKLSGEP